MSTAKYVELESLRRIYALLCADLATTEAADLELSVALWDALDAHAALEVRKP